MIYPENFERKIGFDLIRDMIRELCISPSGQQFVDKIRFLSKTELIEKLLLQVKEFKEIIIKGESFPARDYFDLRIEIARIKTPGTFIEQEVLFDLRSSFRTINDIIVFFRKSHQDLYPELKLLVNDVFLPDELLPKADKIIDDKGNIKSTASEKLSDIRKQLETKQRQVYREIKSAFEKAKKSGWIADNAEITIRNGRSVIPLAAANKRALNGIIHDESATGQTVFVEPAGSFEVNNQIRELENDERREIVRILTNYTDLLRPYNYELTGIFRFLGLIDFIRAKALFAIKINAEQIKISNDKTLDLKQAFHPLLFLSHQNTNKEVIPLDLELNPIDRILVISGPNAGGKSVCLKTIGLLQYMLQCGLHIPCQADSTLPVFKKIFIDIGDEQSLENDLSTYSSHLINMKQLLNNVNEDTFFLIDEFGTGTEPLLGGSIAEATLEQLNFKKAFGVVTTHYTNLKVAAQKYNGLVNGAMLFDSNEMMPLYKLQIGNPGSSFAFEIAKNIGFPTNVLKKAKHKTGGKHVSFDQQLQQFEIDKIAIEKKTLELAGKDEQLSEMIEKYSNLLGDVKRNKKNIIEKARQEAYEIVADSNKAIENTIKEIKEVKASKGKTKDIRKKLDEKKETIKSQLNIKTKVEKNTQTEKKIDGEITIGDNVKIKDTDIVGELIAIEGKDALVDVNDVKLKTSLSKLKKTDKKLSHKSSFRAKQNRQNIMSEINEKAANFNLSIDLRGKRAEEALSILRKYIDEAILLSMNEISILHGKGDGILRPLIREYLQAMDEIKHYGDAPLDMGGAGITKVYFH